MHKLDFCRQTIGHVVSPNFSIRPVVELYWCRRRAVVGATDGNNFTHKPTKTNKSHRIDNYPLILFGCLAFAILCVLRGRGLPTLLEGGYSLSSSFTASQYRLNCHHSCEPPRLLPLFRSPLAMKRNGVHGAPPTRRTSPTSTASSSPVDPAEVQPRSNMLGFFLGGSQGPYR